MSIALFESLCKLCKHRDGWACAAYPQGIPVEIREMRVDHRQPYPGDNGIVFEPKDQTPATLQALERVRVRPGRVPAGPNELDQRISRCWKSIAFTDPQQQRQFVRCVEGANRFDELPGWCQRLILEAEVLQVAHQPGVAG